MIIFETPEVCLPRDRAELRRRARTGVAGRIFAAAYQFTHVDDNFGEGHSSTLVRRDARSYRQAQRSYKCEETQTIE